MTPTEDEKRLMEAIRELPACAKCLSDREKHGDPESRRRALVSAPENEDWNGCDGCLQKILVVILGSARVLVPVFGTGLTCKEFEATYLPDAQAKREFWALLDRETRHVISSFLIGALEGWKGETAKRVLSELQASFCELCGYPMGPDGECTRPEKHGAIGG